MTDQEKPTFGATIVETSALPAQPLRTKTSKDSSNSTSDIATPTAGDREAANPFSGYYSQSASTRPSVEQKQTNSLLTPYNHDLEAGSGTISKTSSNLPKVSVDGRVKECTMWPSKQSLMDKEKERKRRQYGWWNITGNMNKKQRMWFRIIVVLILVAAAVGIGVGVSRAVGGGVWAGQGKTKDIDGH